MLPVADGHTDAVQGAERDHRDDWATHRYHPGDRVTKHAWWRLDKYFKDAETPSAFAYGRFVQAKTPQCRY